MKRPAFRWCALAMAIMLIGSNMVYQVSSSISAHEAEQAYKVEQEVRDAAAGAALQKIADEEETEDSAEALVKETQRKQHSEEERVEVVQIID